MSAMSPKAELSLTNQVRNQINLELRPVVPIAMEQWRRGPERGE